MSVVCKYDTVSSNTIAYTEGHIFTYIAVFKCFTAMT